MSTGKFSQINSRTICNGVDLVHIICLAGSFLQKQFFHSISIYIVEIIIVIFSIRCIDLIQQWTVKILIFRATALIYLSGGIRLSRL